jgi:hypothetical protein
VKYFSIEDSFDIRGRWYLDEPRAADGIEVDSRIFTKCSKYTGSGDLSVQAEKGSVPLDFTFGPFDMPIVKKYVGEMIERCAPGEVQRIPVRIGRSCDYEILNALTLRDAIDEELSEITRWKEKDGWPEKVGQYFGIGELVLKKEKIGDSTVFLLKDWELPLVVCEIIKSQMESDGIAGVSFKELRLS